MSLAELAASEIRLRPAEAVAIVSAICEQHLVGSLPGIPSLGVIRLTRDGELAIEGPITTAQDTVKGAALLLTDLLPGFEALPEYRASGALRLVIARALGTIELPPYASLAEFRAALTRFVTEDVRDVARALFSAWERASITRAFNTAPRDALTISDVRRARRATGMSLGYLATVAEVPPRRLRDLEWGFMREWPATAEARAQVIRYARAAGLDESIVLSIAWPMIVDQSPNEVQTTALVPVGPQGLTVIDAVSTRVMRPRRWRAAIVAAVATASLGALAFGWRSTARATPRQQTTTVAVAPAPERVPPAPAPAVDTAVPAQPVGTRGSAERPRPAPAVVRGTRGSAGPVGVTAKSKRRPAPSRAVSHEEPRKSVLERELFRIVIR